MAAAAAAAVAGEHWGILKELLRVEAAGWVVGDLRGLLVMAIAAEIDDHRCGGAIGGARGGVG